MAKLTTKSRNNLPTTDFAIPSERKYPLPNESHAKNALARVSQFGTPAEKSRVEKAVYKKFPELNKNEFEG